MLCGPVTLEPWLGVYPCAPFASVWKSTEATVIHTQGHGHVQLEAGHGTFSRLMANPRCGTNLTCSFFFLLWRQK